MLCRWVLCARPLSSVWVHPSVDEVDVLRPCMCGILDAPQRCTPAQHACTCMTNASSLPFDQGPVSCSHIHIGSISTERVPNVVLPLGDSNSSSSNGVTLYFLNANLNEQCSAAAAPPSWSGGPLMGASQGAGDAVPGKGPGWELDGGGMHLWSPEGDGDRDGGGGGDAAPPPLDMSMQPVYGSPGDGGDSPMERRILLDVSMYTASIPDCIIGAEVTGVLLSGLEDDTRLPVLRLLDIVVRVGGWEAGTH